MWSKRDTALAVICLTVGSVGQLVQYLVTPLGAPDAPVADNVAKALAHPDAMAAAAWLDLTILFFLPALVVVAALAGARTSRLAWVAGLVAVGTTIVGIAYVLAPDVLYAGAVQGGVTAQAVFAYTESPLVSTATPVFLVGHVLGLVLLAAALWRARAVPRWASVCLGLYPVLEIAGSALDVKPIGIVAYLLLVGAFGACAAALVRDGSARSVAPVTAPVSA
jgi:putative effector of murein hydrolase LrgA (UPF0299 family)